MVDRRRPGLAAVPDRSPLSGTEALVTAVPEPFRVSRGIIRFNADPWLALTYAYAHRWPAQVDLSTLPEAMGHELSWWLYSLRVDGERVNSHVLGSWVKVAAAVSADPDRQVQSFVELSVSEWIAAARARFYCQHGRLPGLRSAGRVTPSA